MQKVTLLMRGILKPGKIMILDEPLAGLDGDTRRKVMDMILAETKGKTLIVITHDKEILPSMDRVVDINKL
jgi:ABC-type transport system involved in cytochrome bd biosynthesis fused ATPase/permease subunit